MSDYMDARNIGYWLQRIYHDLAGSVMVYMDARSDTYWLQQIYKELTGIDLVGDQRSFEWWSEAIYRHIIGDSSGVKGTVPANVSWQLIYASRASAAYPDGSSALSVEFWLQQAQRVGLESSTPPFDPASIPWDYWYKTDALVGLVDGDPIPALTDQSGNGNNATQATGSKRAQYKTNIQNGLPVARLDGIDDAYGFSIAQSFPMEIWAAYNANSPSGYIILLDRNNSDAPAIYVSAAGADGHPTIYWSAGFDPPANEFRYSAPVNGFAVVRWRIAADTAGISVNSGAEQTVSVASSVIASWNGVGNETVQQYRQDIGELLIANGVSLTASEVSNMWAYLNARWGVY